jgi:hypothetical protein
VCKGGFQWPKSKVVVRGGWKKAAIG